MNVSYIYSDVGSSPFVYPLIAPIIILGCYGFFTCLCIYREKITNNIIDPALQINRELSINNNNNNNNNNRN